jgi:Tfp pilus assembly protein PilO
MSMSKREKVLVSIVLVLAVFCMYYLFFLKPNLDELKTVNTDIDNKTIEASNVQQQQQIIQSIDKAISANKAKIDELSDGITEGFDQPAALVYLEQTVNQHATKVGLLFTDPKQVGQFNVSTVTIAMTSTYDGIKELLKAFGDSPYFIKVVSLQAAIDTEQYQQASAPNTTSDGTTQPSTPPSSTADKLNVAMGIEIYAEPGTPAEASYEFADGYQYGGDIFF